MKVYPFVAAEKAAGRTVQQPCALLGVSRSAYYQWTKQERSARAQTDATLREQVSRVHHESRGTYGAPRIHQQLRQDGVRTSRKRVARVMAAAGLQGRAKRRSRKTTIAGSETIAQVDLLGRAFAPATAALDSAWVATSPTSGHGRAGPTWPPSSTRPAGVSSASPSATTGGRSS